ncbi:MAG: hypothetical protein JWO08_3146, partial [Verrucomicrobiaceae bacterium]|nr:hypothetical protein [Verrucomicrobiaceae bacterium]
SFAQQPAAPTAESRLRDALKKLTVRVSEAEAGRATSQAAQAEAEAKNTELTAKLEEATTTIAKLTKQAAADKESTDRTIDGLNGKLAARDKDVAALKEALGKWKDGFNQARNVAIAKESERKQASDKLIIADRKVAEYERKNAAMYKMGTEVLSRYESFGLGTALLSREPFVGTMRVKFENMIQDYGDKLNIERIKPEAGTKKEVPAKTSKTKS